MIGTGALVVGGIWALAGIGIGRHYDPGQGSLTSPQDLGYFGGVILHDTGRAMGNVFFEKELTQKGAIYQPNAIPESEFCYPWDTKCHKGNQSHEYQRQQRQQYEQRRSTY